MVEILIEPIISKDMAFPFRIFSFKLRCGIADNNLTSTESLPIEINLNA